VNKVKEGRPDIVDMIKNGEISLVFTTVDENRSEIADSRSIRTTSQANKVTYYTTISAAAAVVEGLGAINELEVYDLQTLHKSLH
jgi:carbamoyl-phosphate synthase large subunit